MKLAIATSPSVWAGVVIIPSPKAYEPSKELEQIEDTKDEDSNIGEQGGGELQAEIEVINEQSTVKMDFN